LKDKYKNVQMFIALSGLGAILVLSGCTYSTTHVYSSIALQDQNKFKNILVLAEATAGYGKTRQKKAFAFCQASSQQIMERYIHQIKPCFVQKGYNVVDVIPVGLNFLGPVAREFYPDHYIVEDFKAQETKILAGDKDQYVYIYNNNLTETEKDAVRRLAVDIEKACLAKNCNNFRFSIIDLKTIAEKRGADSICFATGYGYYETVTGGDIIKSIITGTLSGGGIGAILFPIGCIANHLETFTAFLIDVESGEMVFEGTQNVENEDKEFEKAISGVLNKLPYRNK